MAKQRHTPEQIIDKLRGELLNVELFDTLYEAWILIER
jgi:hypothetical protein